MPFVIPLTYFFLLPRHRTFSSTLFPASISDATFNAPNEYTSIPSSDDEERSPDISTGDLPPDAYATDKFHIALKLSDKWLLVKPLLLRYMLPLCESLNVLSDVLSYQKSSLCIHSELQVSYTVMFISC